MTPSPTTSSSAGRQAPQPALATLSHDRFWEPGWIYERKLDGERCLAVRAGGGVRLMSRTDRDISGSFPEIVDALESQPARSHRVRADDAWFTDICTRGWEGVIAKRADAAYHSGRTKDWLKFRCEARQEFVIVGWTDPHGSRVALGALLIGYHDGEDLVYAGKVGTGFSTETLRDLRDRLSGRERATSPCTSGYLPSTGVHWAQPQLVGEVAFTEWTRAGQLRHPRFLGLRRDKDPTEVVRE